MGRPGRRPGWGGVATVDERRPRAAAVRTFLIADIRGYTRFTALHGDDAASRLAGRFAEIVAEGVEAWGGELVELRGDEALAAFESARRALRAAVELQAAFAAEADGDPLLPLRVGIGLDAGEAVPLGDGFRGAALNQAARLCAAAGPGEVLATEGLVHLAGQVGGLAFGPPERTAFKGIDDGVAVIRVRTADEGAASVSGPPAPAQPGTPTAVASSATLPPPLSPELDPIVPIIGRDPELRWLRWHWRRARHGSGRTVVVSGQPGIGKTRLAAELATEAHAAGAMVRYIQGGRGHALEAVPAAPADRPLLTVVDDLDAGGPELTRATSALAVELAGRAHLLLVIHRLEAPPPLQALAATLAPEERRRTVGPLDGAAVRAITGLYAGRAADDAPLGEIIAESDGVPAAVHRVASRWARTAATRRLGLSAGRTSTERHELRAAEDALVDDLADLEHVRDLALLYVERDDGDGPFQPRTVCPYKGLAAFDAADADYFFGRDRLVAELVAKSVGARFVGLVGDLGSGKSSALRAGLLPALAAGVLPGSDHWPQVVIRPGETPLAEVARALARTFPDAGLPAADAAAALDGALARLAAGHRLLLVVDQFEEIFNATRDEAERSAFVDLLTAERTGLKVIIAMRADHYGRCAVYPALARLLGSEQVLVGPLSATELAAVIEHPAQRVGLRVEPALTEAIVADAGREPGVLPLLSTTLLELWGLRDGGRLTLASYRATGGLHGAIARLAEATFAELDPHRQRVARSLLLRLAGPGEGTALVRRSVALDELDADSDPAVAEVLGRLTAARLLTTGEGHVEVAHEALLREWPRLQGWLDEDAAGRQVRLHLIGAVRDWETRGRDAGDLYRGARLATAMEWAADRDVELNAAERAFLDESRRAAEADVERTRRTNRRLKGLLAGAAALLLVAVGAGAVALAQGQRAQDEAERAGFQAERAAAEAARAEDQREIAEQEAGRARSRELLASALVATDEDPALAKALAAAALDGGDEPTLQATRILHDVIAADPVVARYRAPTDAEMGLLWTDLDPAGERLVASGTVDDPAQHLEVADARTGEVAWSFDVEAPTKTGPAFFSPDGSTVVVGVIWDDEDVPPRGTGSGSRSGTREPARSSGRSTRGAAAATWWGSRGTGRWSGRSGANPDPRAAVAGTGTAIPASRSSTSRRGNRGCWRRGPSWCSAAPSAPTAGSRRSRCRRRAGACRWSSTWRPAAASSSSTRGPSRRASTRGMPGFSALTGRSSSSATARSSSTMSPAARPSRSPSCRAPAAKATSRRSTRVARWSTRPPATARSAPGTRARRRRSARGRPPGTGGCRMPPTGARSLSGRRSTPARLSSTWGRGASSAAWPRAKASSPRAASSSGRAGRRS